MRIYIALSFLLLLCREFRLRNRKNENARQILDILDSATGKMRIYIALAFLLLLCREYFRLRNRKNENVSQILDINYLFLHNCLLLGLRQRLQSPQGRALQNLQPSIWQRRLLLSFVPALGLRLEEVNIVLTSNI